MRKDVYLLLGLPLATQFTLEYLSKGSLLWTLKGVYHFNAFLLTWLILVATLFLLSRLLGRLSWAHYALAAPLLFLTYVSGIKRQILGLPLMPWDVFLAHEVAPLAGYWKSFFNLSMVLAIVFFGALSWFLLRGPQERIPLRTRGNLAGVLLAAAFLVVTFTGTPFSVHQLFRIVHSATLPLNNYLINGFILSTATNLNQSFIKEPKNYCRDTILALQAPAPCPNVAPPVKPDVIVILAESFWDPTLLPGVRFSEDPIPTYHALCKAFSHGMMVSPQFGGWTANVEFEVLTASSVRFLPQGSVAYNQYLGRSLPSLASVLRQQGYRAVAISPYFNWYNNVDQVYRNLGFSNFVSGEFMTPNLKGSYLADEEVARTIVEQTDSTPGPVFIHANTMENHGAYKPNKFKENPIQVAGPLTKEGQGALTAYVTGLHDTDRMLASLVDHYSRSSKPTLMVFYGDHMPSLGNDYLVYKDTGYLASASQDRFQLLNRVPLLVWDNFLPPKADDLNFNAFYIVPYLLGRLGMKGTPLMDFLRRQLTSFPVVPPPGLYAKYGIAPAFLRGFELLEYDQMFGARYALGGNTMAPDPNFRLGQDPAIDRVARQGTSLVVEGRFPTQSKVFLDGQPREATPEGPGRLRVLAGQAGIRPGSWVQLKVIDSELKVLAASAKVPIL